MITLWTVGLSGHASLSSGQEIVAKGQEIVTIRRPLLRSIRFVDRLHGWSAGYNGVFYTSDGGNRWRRLPVSLGSVLRFTTTTAVRDLGSIVWADRDKSIIRNDRGLALGTVGAARWSAMVIPIDLLVGMNEIDFVDRTHGFASGTLLHYVYRTNDGGVSWERLETPADDILEGLFVMSASELWVVGVEGIVLHTTDSGRSWSNMILSNENGEPATGLRSIWFIDHQRGWVCGPSGSIFHTANGGKDWQRQKTPFVENIPVALNVVSFANENEGWAVGEYCADSVEEKFEGIVLHTTDGGRHWDWQPIDLAESLLDVQALPNGRVWAVSEQGTVIRTVDRGKHWRAVKFGPNRKTIVFPAKK
jgi:photosystem II stability/assembly factor-like uncharacterized protein